MIRVAVVPILILFTACAFGVPPLRADLGQSWRTDGAFRRVAVGTSLGSFARIKDAPVDVGGGAVFDIAPSTGSTMTAETTRGTYVDGQVVAWNNNFARVLAGMRYELYTSGPIEQAVKLRLDAEVLHHVESSFSYAEGTESTVGGAMGNFGIGVYAEAGPNWSPEDARGWSATIGITGRMPGWGFFAWAFPGGSSSGGGGGDSHHHAIGPLSDD